MAGQYFHWKGAHWDTSKAFALLDEDYVYDTKDTISVPDWAARLGEVGLTVKDCLGVPDSWLTNVPVMLARVDGEVVLLDGWHRVGKAASLGLPTLPACWLTPSQERRARLQSVII